MAGFDINKALLEIEAQNREKIRIPKKEDIKSVVVQKEPQEQKSESSPAVSEESVAAEEKTDVSQSVKTEDTTGGANNEARVSDADDASTDLPSDESTDSQGEEPQESEEDVLPVKQSTDKTVSKKPSGRRVVKPPMQSGVSETVQIRDFPRNLLDIAKTEFPSAKNKTDALTAYMLVKSGVQVDNISDEVMKLIDEYEGDNTLIDLEKRMSNLERQNFAILNLLREIKLATVYLVYDRAGFKRENPKDAASINYLENGVTDAMNRLQVQARQNTKQENIKSGRPIK